MILLLCRDNFVTANIFDEDNFDILWTKATRADTTLAVGPFGSDPVILRNVIECALENTAVLKIFFKRNRATFQEISFFEGRVYKYSDEGFNKIVFVFFINLFSFSETFFFRKIKTDPF